MFGSLRYYRDYAVALAAYIYGRTQHKALPTLSHLQDIRRLSPRVVCVLGQNPGPFTLQGTNTYLIGTGANRILVDTGEPNKPDFIRKLKDAMSIEKVKSLKALVITHWHEDHVGGVPDVLREISPSAPVYKLKYKGDKAESFEYISDGAVISTEGATLRVVATPGHTVDHVCLWLEEEKAVLTGDCILGEGSTVFEDLHDYMKSLRTIESLNATRLYPGHGPHIDEADAKVKEYIHHREDRERQILETMKKLNADVTPMDITKAIYTDIPSSLTLAAMHSVEHHLTKLIKDKRVEKTIGKFYRLIQ